MKVTTRDAVRFLVHRDLDEILAIEAAVFGPHAWDKEQLKKILKTPRVLGSVVERHTQIDPDTYWSEVVGYSIHKAQGKYLVLLNLAVRAEARRQGVGTRLVGGLVDCVRRSRRRGIEACLGERNVGGQLFMKAMGFRAVGIIPPEDGVGDDIYLMKYAVRGDG